MPSPRWPMRPIVSRSTTAGRDKEFAIAVAAEDRRGRDTGDAPTTCDKKRFDVRADGRVHRRIADDAFFDAAARCFELRLDQRQQTSARHQPLFDRRQDQLERDEAYGDGRKIRQFAEARTIERTNVGLLERHESAAAAQFLMQLVAADVDRIDMPRAASEQNFSKAPGGRADVEANAILDIEAETIERGRQFDAAARDVGMFGFSFDV